MRRLASRSDNAWDLQKNVPLRIVESDEESDGAHDGEAGLWGCSLDEPRYSCVGVVSSRSHNSRLSEGTFSPASIIEGRYSDTT
jgi:hypothetical protein